MFEIRSSLNQKDGLLSQRIYHNQLLFSMTYSLCPLLILSHQIRRWRKFWKHIIDGINLLHHLQQEEKSGKRKIACCSILKLMDGGQAKPCKLGNLFLGERRLQMTQIRPSLHHSHINVFSSKKYQSIIIYKYITDT